MYHYIPEHKLSYLYLIILCRDLPRGEAGGAVTPPDFGRSEGAAGQWRRTALLHCLMILLEILLLTTLLLVTIVDAYRFYTKLLFSIKSKVVSYATKCNLA